METISLITSLVSLIVGILAIALSYGFFKLSNDNVKESTRESTEALRKVSSNTDTLQVIFSLFYKDTFQIMKDVLFMDRDRLVPSLTAIDEKYKEIEKAENEKIEKLKNDFSDQIVTAISQIGQITDNKLKEAHHDINKIADDLISKSRNIEIEKQNEFQVAIGVDYLLKLIPVGTEIQLKRILYDPFMIANCPQPMLTRAVKVLEKGKQVILTGSIDDPNSIVKRINK